MVYVTSVTYLGPKIEIPPEFPERKKKIFYKFNVYGNRKKKKNVTNSFDFCGNKRLNKLTVFEKKNYRLKNKNERKNVTNSFDFCGNKRLNKLT